MPRICWPGTVTKWLTMLCVVWALSIASTLPGYSGFQMPESEPNPLAGCVMCHVDVEYEYVGSPHFAKQMGCRQCHGPSEGHIADENNDVKPDGVFNKENVEDLCGTCHPVSAGPELSFSSGSHALGCTDCHGYHDQQLLVLLP